MATPGPQPPSQQATQSPPKRGNRGRSSLTDLGNVQLPGGSHLPHHLLGVPRHAPARQSAHNAFIQVGEISPWEDCAVANHPLLVQQESRPCHHPAVALHLCQYRIRLCPKYLRQSATSHSHPKSLGDVEALVTDYGEACVGRGRPLNKLQMRTNKGQLTSKPGEWRSHCPQRWQPPFVIIIGFIV